MATIGLTMSPYIREASKLQGVQVAVADVRGRAKVHGDHSVHCKSTDVE